MQLTKLERLLLANQFRILGRLDPSSAAYKEACEVLESGFALEYGELVSNFDSDLSEEKCREVRDILEMFRALQNALHQLPPGSVKAHDVTFQGFDGNEEGAQHAYARFLIETQGKWRESKIPDLNAHWPRLGAYRAMCNAWHASADKWHLTVEDLERIVSHKG
jgi:uncharacterized protein YfbU (UPF0304 family)